MTTSKRDWGTSIPLGSWDLKGHWYPNPFLKMSGADQFRHNVKHGYLDPLSEEIGAKAEMLAQWLDDYDIAHGIIGKHEVQDDLRSWAKRIKELEDNQR